MSYSTIGWEDYPSVKTPITAANLKKMDEQIKDNTDNLETLMNKSETIITGILNAGETSLTFTNDAITDSCYVDFYTNPAGRCFKTASQSDTSIITTWKSYDDDTTIKLVITEK